jgi:transposase
MIDLVRSGRTPEDLAREFEPTAQSISTWVKQAERDASKRVDRPTSTEREELGRLRRENHRLRQERDILAKAAAWFARESKASPNGSTGS